MADYAHPEVLVSTDWVAQNLSNPSLRIVGVDVDTKAYDEGHIPGAIGWAWNTQLCDSVQHCSADNVSPGANIARTEGTTREEAENKALERAKQLLCRTRRQSIGS